ncbi:MAG TPA: hypothetical protein VGD13_08150 [Xanthobacteraceae bacterium]
MMVFSSLMLGASLVVGVVSQVPVFNIEPSCKAAGVSGGDVRRNACLRTEREAREQLNKDWGGFVAADRTRCVETSTMGGASRSYVELLTCLEIARDVRKLPKDNTAPIERDRGTRRAR